MRKAELGQFMTPAPIAQFMASLFQRWPNSARLLDAGAGTGSLSDAFATAFCEKAPKGAELTISAFEIDSLMIQALTINLASVQRLLKDKGFRSDVEIHTRDYIQEASFAASFSLGKFTHVILNPPYKKIGASSDHRNALRAVGIETVNLYSAFLGLSILQTEQLGEIVAIIPRSFCNGLYFKPFRSLLLENSSIQHIHIFESRNSAFRDDAVLQENIIVHLVRGGTQGNVTISTSNDATFDNYSSRNVEFFEIVRPADEEKFIHIPIVDLDQDSRLLTHSLAELALDVSTGPVVDFRMGEHWLAEPTPGSVPLLYAHHFSGGRFQWPREHKKPNALPLNEATRKWLFPRGWYVITKRFSAKEERRRVVAYVVDPNNFESDFLGFENHLNVIHAGKEGLPRDLAYGLALFLNSTILDQYFRSFSGHTQINATDLRAMKFPSIAILRKFGRWAQSQSDLDQARIDAFITKHSAII